MTWKVFDKISLWSQYFEVLPGQRAEGYNGEPGQGKDLFTTPGMVVIFPFLHQGVVDVTSTGKYHLEIATPSGTVTYSITLG